MQNALSCTVNQASLEQHFVYLHNVVLHTAFRQITFQENINTCTTHIILLQAQELVASECTRFTCSGQCSHTLQTFPSAERFRSASSSTREGEISTTLFLFLSISRTFQGNSVARYSPCLLSKDFTGS